jgi:hypothetical protein
MLAKNSWLNIDLLLIFAWALLVVYSLLINDAPVVIWPAIASLPGVINMNDITLLSQDFYAMSSQGSPVIIYQKILFFIESVSGLGPFKSLGMIGTLVVAFYIPTLFFLLAYALNRWISRSQTEVKRENQLNTFIIILIFIACIFLIQFSQIFNSVFGFMGWPPIFLIPAPYIISMLIGFSAFLFKTKYIHAVLCMVSCLIHPTMGGATIIFGSLLFTDFKSRKEILNLILWSFIPVGLAYLILILNFPQQRLGSIDFIDIYIKYRHPHHYLISESFNVMKYFIVIVTPLSIMYLILARLKSGMKINCFLALVVITLIPLFHYIFTEVYAIKEVAILGATRFFMLCLFLLIFFGVVTAVELLNSFKPLSFFRYQLYFINRLFARFRSLLNRNTALTFIIMFLMLSIPMFGFATKEFDRIDRDEIKFNSTYKNILYTIQRNDVVMVLDADSFGFGLLGRVNLFASGAFPFSTSKFHEFKIRGELWSACKKKLNKDTVTAAAKNYKLDSILMKKDRLLSINEDMILSQSDDLVLIDVKKYLQSFNGE